MAPKSPTPDLLEELKAVLAEAGPEERAATVRLVKYIESLRAKCQGHRFSIPMLSFSVMMEQTAIATLLNWLEANKAPEQVSTLVKNIHSIEHYIRMLENHTANAEGIEKYDGEALLLETAEAITVLGGSWVSPLSANISQPRPDRFE